MNDEELKAAITHARRKEELLAHGVLLRADLTLAKAAVKSQLKPDSLAHNIFNQVAAAAFSLIKNRSSLSAGSLPRMLPLVVSGVAMLARRGWLKPVFKLGLVLGGVAAVAGIVIRGRRMAAARRLAR